MRRNINILSECEGWVGAMGELVELYRKNKRILSERQGIRGKSQVFCF